MRLAVVIAAGSLLAIAIGGCTEAPTELTLAEQVEKLTKSNDELGVQLERVESEKHQLENQVRALSGLSSEIRLENLYDLKTVTLGNYTNLYDKDKDGSKEKLIVYLKLVDAQGDFIKASGAVDIELWDLSKEPADALLGGWHKEPADLKKLWYSTLMGTHYRLVLDVSDAVEKFEEPLTVKVTFTDYITGKVFRLQKVIEP